MRGISGSGKSTRAREIAQQAGGVVVNRDLLRLQLLGEWWTGEKLDEDRVTIAEEAMVKALLKQGVPTVVDATHLEPAFLRKWARTASRHGAEFEVADVAADVDDCKRRAYDRWSNALGTEMARYIDPKVIDNQAKRFAKRVKVTADPPFVVTPVGWIDGLPEAIIVDIDGTVAHCEGNRSPYDYTKVSGDLPDSTIIQLVRDWRAQHPEGSVLFVSGRDDTCFADAEQWLFLQNVPADWLFMRPTEAVDSRGNKLPDFIVKANIYDSYIRGKWNVLFVLDDREQVVTQTWRAMGLKCLQVEPGDF